MIVLFRDEPEPQTLPEDTTAQSENISGSQLQTICDHIMEFDAKERKIGAERRL